jgi:hypothetical protein
LVEDVVNHGADLIDQARRRLSILTGQNDGMASTIPGSARELVRAVVQAVHAANGDDAAAYERWTARLATQPAGGRVLGDVLRSLLEDTHPDGFASDDITQVIGRCNRAATAWLPPERVDVTVLLAVLASALGIHEPGVTYEALDLPRGGVDVDGDADEAVPVRPPTWPDYAWHAPLVVADLLPHAPVTLDVYLESTFAEYAREARQEQP